MTSESIERRLEGLKRMVDDPNISSTLRQIWSGRIEGFTRVLKERAEQGVI